MREKCLKTELEEILKPVGQEHLLRFWDELSESEQKGFTEELKSVKWPKVCMSVREVLQNKNKSIPFEKLRPAPYVSLNAKPDYLAQCKERGEKLLSEGKVAGFTVAGGQGTRLGYSGPKGTYCFTELGHKSLFQVFAEGILRHQEKCGHVLPWYIMTSSMNDQATRDFFVEHQYFGLEPANVTFFSQGMLPAFDLNGKAILRTKSSLAFSANGHGGSFAALHDSGALADMKKRGVEILSYWQVDNALVNQFDATFIGMHSITESEMSSRALIKRSPLEKLGHFCMLDDKMIIVEYSDMPENLLYQQDKNELLSYRAGSPAIHILNCEFIERLTNGVLDFKLHRALKKVPFVDAEGVEHKPDKPNAIKLESFLFDALPLAKNPLVFEGNRAEQFAPIKNAEGEDSPESCRKAMQERAIAWYEQTERTFPRYDDGSPAAVIELSPKRAVDAEDGVSFFEKRPAIQFGDCLNLE